MKWMSLLALALGLSFVGLLLSGCGATEEPCPEVDCPECPTAESCPEEACPECPELVACAPPVGASKYELSWVSSAHADAGAEAITHWNEDDPRVIPSACAKCHSEGGFLDFLGADGSEAGVVYNDAEAGTTVTCNACHNAVAATWDTVVFPSGAEIAALGAEARCMECHQGRASTFTVDDSIASAGIADLDTVSEDLHFSNIHYYAAAASMYGTLAKGGYEYEGKTYDAKHDHVPGMDTCLDCHDAHTLEVRVEVCGTCHPGVTSLEDLRNNRMMDSLVDYDGDGKMDEGIHYEIEGLREMLYRAIQAYASEVSGTPIVYDGQTYPYFFVDSDGNGEADEGEAAYENQYGAWTGRLAKAAYNYQTSVKDPGAYAHGPKYIIQLLYDSVEDLNQALTVPVDLSAAHRIDHRHFAGSEPAFRNWDDGGVVPRHCSRCHTAGGLPLYVTDGASISQRPSNGLNCATCHDSLPEFTVYQVPWVRFPRGALIDSGDPNTNLCLNCHQGLSPLPR